MKIRQNILLKTERCWKTIKDLYTYIDENTWNMLKGMTFVKIHKYVESDETHKKMSKYAKYIEIHNANWKTKRMKDITFVEKYEIRCNMYKYWNWTKYVEKYEMR